MRFRILGPLDVFENDESITLSGTNQRAALGYLLLHPNGVVATSQLLQALWGEDAPPTARKMLQNAISGLRRALVSAADKDASHLLVTHAPGYQLQVNPEDVDLCCFQDLAKKGQAELDEGRWDEADRDLRDALGLWRGPALADLIEDGYQWPELTALENAKYAVLESRMEAAIAAGRHLEVIGELELMVSAEPMRERLCRHLMLALYRAGRQADALGAYRRTRSALVRQLGLDPSPELRELERAILDHDPGLVASGGAAVRAVTSSPLAADALSYTGEPAPVTSSPAGVERSSSVVPARRSGPVPVSGGERKRVTAVFVRVDVVDADATPETLDRLLAQVGEGVRYQVCRYGGRNHGSMGPISLALFGTDETQEDDALHAVRVATALGATAPDGVLLRVVVAGGEALVVRREEGAAGGGEPLAVTGRFFDEGLDLLFDATPGVVRACGDTRQVCSEHFVFTPSRTAVGGYDVTAKAKVDPTYRTDVPLVQRDRELQQLGWWLEDVRRRERPHLVTVLGAAGIGKSRIMHEFRREVMEREEVRCLVGCNRGFGPETPYNALADVIREYAGIAADDSAPEEDRKLDDAMTGLVGSGPIAVQLADNLRDLVARPRDVGIGGPSRRVDHRVAFAAWRRFVEELAAREPLVIILEDLTRIDDVLLKFVGDLAETVGNLPLLVVVTARPELANRAPYWAGGQRSATTMSLEPLSRSGTCALLERLLPQPADAGTAEVCADLVDQVGGNPLFAMEYARVVRAELAGGGRAPGRGIPVPHRVHNIISARLDTLPDREKAVLYDASLFGGSFSRTVLAALGGRDEEDIQEFLESLERNEFLRRCRLGAEVGDIEYAFVHQLVSEVAYSRLPHGVRAEKHRKAAEWLDALQDRPVGPLAHHFRQAVHNAEQAGRPTSAISTQACDCLVRGGHLALSQGMPEVARDYYRAALDFCSLQHPQRHLLLRWQDHTPLPLANVTAPAGRGAGGSPRPAAPIETPRR